VEWASKTYSDETVEVLHGNNGTLCCELAMKRGRVVSDRNEERSLLGLVPIMQEERERTAITDTCPHVQYNITHSNLRCLKYVAHEGTYAFLRAFRRVLSI
jgi:hypothetical protein